MSMWFNGPLPDKLDLRSLAADGTGCLSREEERQAADAMELLAEVLGEEVIRHALERKHWPLASVVALRSRGLDENWCG